MDCPNCGAGGVYPEGNPIPWRPGMVAGEAQVLYRLGFGTETRDES